MWPAPTRLDWTRPCLIRWQRNFDDAVQLARRTGRPLLICVNMDGEIASEHYAGVRYRDPAIAALYEPYVTVIASVYRHTPRDHQEDGTRIPCPRFGTVTCGEHISIEPGLFERYFEGERVAPRHIALELDQGETFDVYYALDTASVFRTIEETIRNRPTPPLTEDRGDLTPVALLDSTDSADRETVETAFASGDRLLRRRVLEKLRALPDLNPLALVRLALSGGDATERALALEILARDTSVGAVDLIALALRQGVDGAREQELLVALDRLAAILPRAATLARAYRGLAASAGAGEGSSGLDPAAWQAKDRGHGPALATNATLTARLQYRAQAIGSKAEPHPDAMPSEEEAEDRLDLAEAFLELALHPDTANRSAELMLKDAVRLALEARAGGATPWRVSTTLCLAYDWEGRDEQATSEALRAAPDLPDDTSGPGVAKVLTLFATARRTELLAALRDGSPWDPSWLADAHGAFEVLVRLGEGTEELALAHHGLLYRLGATGEAARVLDGAIARFPASWDLHARLRSRLVNEKSLDGLNGLEATYERLLANEGAAPVLAWYAGYSSMVAAEFHRRAASADPARAAAAARAYVRAIAHLESSIANGGATPSAANHYIALALAGRAKLALEANDLDASLAHIHASFIRHPAAAGDLDGLNDSPVSIARMLLARLDAADMLEQSQRLSDALKALPPEELLPPAFEVRRLPRRRPNGPGRGPGGRR
jgi:hypothetical protein